VKICLLILAFVLIQGCNNEPTEGKKNTEKTGFGLLDAENTKWQRPCEVDEDSKSSKRRSLQLYKRMAVFTLSYFDQEDCTDERMRYEHSYGDVMKEVTQEEKGWDLFYYNQYSYNALVKKVRTLKYFNEKSYFGYDDWQLNLPKDIAGRQFDSGYDAEPENGSVRSANIKREGDRLYFMRYENGTPMAEQDYFYELVK
jgi:hypothetical protein